MRYGWAALAAACLVTFSVQAQESPLQQQYSHVQDLNNKAWDLAHATPADPRKLEAAADLLRQSLAAEEAMEPALRDQSWLDSAAGSRHHDALRALAGVYALQGKSDLALDTLERLLRESYVGVSYVPLLDKDPALVSLRDTPRYKAVIATLGRLGDRWTAPAIAITSPELDEAHRIAGLSLLWSEARYNFVYFDHVPDLDWNQAYVDTLPKVIAARSLHAYYDALMRMAALLHDGHSNVVPPKSIQNEFYAAPAIRTGWIDGHVLVTRVESPALATQVHVGEEIISIDGQDVQRYAQEWVLPYVNSSTPQDTRVKTYDYMLLAGDHRRPVVLGLRDAAGRAHQETLSREPDASATSPPSFEWRMLPGGVAYLAVNEFADDAGLKAFEREWPTILKAKGVILDVRNNGGGYTQYGQAILGYLSDQPIASAQQSSPDYVPVFRAWNGPSTRWHSLPTDDFRGEHDQVYKGPVIVLAGARTFSAAEDFVMMFDAMKRGTLIGEATGGSTGQPLSFALPGGGSARVCAKRDTYPDGREFVGKGIEPQITVTPTVADIRAGRDPVLARALAVLAGRAGKAVTPAP